MPPKAPPAPQSPPPPTWWQLCTARNSKPNAKTFPALPDYAKLLRFFLGAAYGLSLGLRGETGLLGALFGLNVVTFLPMFWFNTYLDADVDSYKSLNFVGVANALAGMMLVWIFLFTLSHGEEEAMLVAGLALEETVGVVGDGGVGDIVGEGASDAAAGFSDDAGMGGMESEF